MDQADTTIDQLSAALSAVLGAARQHGLFTAWNFPGWGEARLYARHHEPGRLFELWVADGSSEPPKLVAAVRSAAEIPGAVDSIRELLDSRRQ